MNDRFKFIEKWDVPSGIDWWDECRKELNEIIDDYNQWQINEFDADIGKNIMAKIEYGRQTFGKRDGGSSYLEELDNMLGFVKSVLRHNKELSRINKIKEGE